MSHIKIRAAISVVCVAVAIAHNVWPNVTIDATTLSLVLLALLPWLTSVLKSIELPGGFKIELQDIKSAVDKVTQAEASASPAAEPAPTSRGTRDGRSTGTTEKPIGGLDTSDPNLALVGIRIEIEKRLARLAEQADLRPRSASLVLRDLVAHDMINRRRAGGLQDLIALGNQAAHGADVSVGAARWALDAAPAVLGVLDDAIEQAERRTSKTSIGGY